MCNFALKHGAFQPLNLSLSCFFISLVHYHFVIVKKKDSTAFKIVMICILFCYYRIPIDTEILNFYLEFPGLEMSLKLIALQF